MAIRVSKPRYINLYPKSVDAGLGQKVVMYEEIPGLTVFANLGAPVRGVYTTTDGACYAAAGSSIYRVNSDGTTTLLGALLSSSGPVEIDENTDEIALMDGTSGYIVTLATGVVSRIVDPAFYGSKRIAVIDGRGILIHPNTQQFYITGINSFSSFDALEFASAEGSPDKSTAVLADHRQARIFGTRTTEGWFNSGDPDFPFSRDQSSYAEIGTTAPYTPRLASNSVCWVGSSAEGNCVVYMATGNAIQRISTPEIEELLGATTDITAASAYTYQEDGSLFYVLNAPGLETTLVFEISTSEWHERAEVGANGGYAPHRATCHTYAFGYHLVGAEDGKLYRFDRTVYTNAGDPLPRERIYPQNAIPSGAKEYFGAYDLQATHGRAPSGEIPKVSLRYSNDGGNTWQGWRERELGRTGEFKNRARWLSNGSAYDRVWHERCTDNAPFSIVTGGAPANHA